MNRNNGVRTAIYRGTLKSPPASPQHVRFASCDRLPQAKQPEAPRRAWIRFLGDLFRFLLKLSRFFISIGVVILVAELVLQIILYGFLRAPIAGPPNHSGLNITTHYDVLGVDHDADQNMINAAWHLKEGIAHPDYVGNTEASREAYYWVQLAYVELSDPLARCYHDQYHGLVLRRFGKDDPCTQILVKRTKDARERMEKYGRPDGPLAETDGRPLSHDEREKRKHERIRQRVLDEEERLAKEKRDKKMAAAREANRQQLLDEYGGVLAEVVELARRMAAWPIIGLGFLVGLGQLLVEYISGLAEWFNLWRRVDG